MFNSYNLVDDGYEVDHIVDGGGYNPDTYPNGLIIIHTNSNPIISIRDLIIDYLVLQHYTSSCIRVMFNNVTVNETLF